MNLFEKLSIKGKFTFILSVSFILLLLAGIISTYKAVKASNSSDTVVNEIIPSVNELGVLTGLFKELRITAIKMPTAKNGSVSALKEKYAKDYGSITDTVNALNVVFTKEETQTLLKDLSDYDSVVKNELTALCTQGKVPEATAVIRNKLVPIGNSFDKHTATLEKKLEEYSKQSSENLSSDVNPTVTIVFLLLVLVLNAFFFIKLSKSITSRIRILAEASDRFSDGNLTQEVGYLGSDELGKLRKNLNHLRESLQKIVGEMSSDASVLGTSSSEMTRISEAIDTKASNVLDKLISVSSASEEMAATSQEISSNCNLAAASSEQSMAMAHDGMLSVENTVNEIRAHSQKTKEDAQLILALDKKTQEINTIITTIDEIASQTNLLALNAAIEAARAGEYGKGFAVVADEVRALAVRSASATKQISSMITTVSDGVNKANESITQTVEKMVKIAENAEQLQNTLTQMTSKIGDVNMEITQIATATEQQSSTSKEMSSNLQSIKEITKDMADTAHNVESCSSSFSNITVRMNNTVGKFRI